MTERDSSFVPFKCLAPECDWIIQSSDDSSQCPQHPGMLPRLPIVTISPFLENMTDEELLDLEQQYVRERHARSKAKLAADLSFAYGKTLPENQWPRLQLNKQTLKDMGRNHNGSPRE